MTDSDREFRIRPGKPGSTRAPRAKSFINQVLRAAQKAGHVSTTRSAAGPARSRGGSASGAGITA